MPAIRLSTRRRRSSHAIFTPAKPGVYGVVHPRPVTFAPNVTPITYVETDDDDLLSSPTSPPSPSLSQHHTTLFPPSSTPAPPPARKRCPPGKRRSQGYIPRPPNAFMLFRADFVRQKHVPGSIETNHGSLSKIIGNCWRSLPLDEKRIWEIRAKQEKANHKAQFPDYRFRPVHNKNKNKLKSSTTTSSTDPTTSSSSTNNPDGTTQEEEERRCEQVAQLLLEGMKGEDLARAVKDLDRVREEAASTSRTQPTTTFDAGSLAMPIPMSSFHNPFPFGEYGFGMNSNSGLALPPSAAYHRRSSSVPLPLPNGSEFFLPSFGEYPAAPQALDINSIALPSVPFISSHTRPSSPVNNISRQHQQRTVLGHRRASSAQPVVRRSWALPFYPTSNSNTFLTGGNGTNFNNTDMSGFDWSSMMNSNIQVERDESPLPEVDLELFNGFSFDEGVSSGVDTSTTSALSSNTLSSVASSSSSSSVSDRSSPWLDTPNHSHARIHPHLAIAPHDLPPLDVSSDMNWRGPSTQSQPQTLPSASSTTSTTSSSSTFPSPSLSAPDATTTITTTNEKHANPTQGMFDMGGLGIDFGLGMDMNGMGGVDYGYEMPMGFGDMGLGYNHHTESGGGGGGNDIGMVIPASEMDTMWGVSQA